MNKFKIKILNEKEGSCHNLTAIFYAECKKLYILSDTVQG
jgi:hypothetical protein